MRLARLIVVALLGLLPAAQAAQPASCRVDDRSAACRLASGILWKIERAGRQPSHLFGTIHLDDPRVTTLPAPVRAAFDAARSFTMEMIVDADTVQELARVAILTDGRTLDTIIGAERYTALERAFVARDLPAASLKLMQPWLAATTLMTPAQMNFLDLQLQARAQRQKKPVHGLETAQEQLHAFTTLGAEEQLMLVDEALRVYADLPKQIEEMTQAYLARDLAGIDRLMKKYGLRDERLNTRLMKQLLDERNRRMVERLRARLDEGGAFVAIGVGHLAGDNGVLALLERAGWRVTPVY